MKPSGTVGLVLLCLRSPALPRGNIGRIRDAARRFGDLASHTDCDVET